MNTLARRVIRLGAVTVGLAGLLVAVNPIPGAVTPPAGLTNQLLARGTDMSDGTLPIRQGSDVVVSKITVVPGGSSGWHSHPGGAIVIVQRSGLRRKQRLDELRRHRGISGRTRGRLIED